MVRLIVGGIIFFLRVFSVNINLMFLFVLSECLSWFLVLLMFSDFVCLLKIDLMVIVFVLLLSGVFVLCVLM